MKDDEFENEGKVHWFRKIGAILLVVGIFASALFIILQISQQQPSVPPPIEPEPVPQVDVRSNRTLTNDSIRFDYIVVNLENHTTEVILGIFINGAEQERDIDVVEPFTTHQGSFVILIQETPFSAELRLISARWVS